MLRDVTATRVTRRLRSHASEKCIRPCRHLVYCVCSLLEGNRRRGTSVAASRIRAERVSCPSNFASLDFRGESRRGYPSWLFRILSFVPPFLFPGLLLLLHLLQCVRWYARGGLDYSLPFPSSLLPSKRFNVCNLVLCPTRDGSRDKQERKVTKACSQSWHVLSRQLVSQRVERRPESSSPPKRRARARRPLEASRNLIVTGIYMNTMCKVYTSTNLPSINKLFI